MWQSVSKGNWPHASVHSRGEGQPLRLIVPQSRDALGKRNVVTVIGDHRGIPDDCLYGRFREHDERRTACKSFQRLKSKSLVLRGLNAQSCACVALPQVFIRDPSEKVKSPIDSGLGEPPRKYVHAAPRGSRR